MTRTLDTAAYERRRAYYEAKGRKRGRTQGAVRDGLLVIVAGLVILGLLLVASRPAQAATKPVLGRCVAVPSIHAFKCPVGKNAYAFVKLSVRDGRVTLRTFGLTA